jgi:glycosyltransferase involved in cell wall biosynthesis
MTPGTQPLVSIVTPVYNGAKYIADCLESILRQTYQNWECTVVNNCSTDESGAIARQFAVRDSRIRVRDNDQFLRAVANYNVAIRQISPGSKYCKVVFADDWIFPECLERMVAVAEAHPSVGIVGAYGLEGSRVNWTGLPYPSTMVSGSEICRRLFLDRLYVFGSATSLLYRADLARARDPFYNEANIHSDIEICLVLLKTCDFGFVHQVLSYTREEEPGCLRSISEELHTYAAGALHDLVTYGPEFLTPLEYKTCLDRMVSEYYGILSGAVLRVRNKQFWSFHRRKLTEAGVGFSVARLVWVMFGKLCVAVLNPKAAIEKGWEVGQQIAARRRPPVEKTIRLRRRPPIPAE